MDRHDTQLLTKLETMAPLKSRTKFDMFNEYAAVLDIDGNAWSDRFSRLLFFNTPILKQQSPWKEYFAHLDDLDDIVISFQRNLSDLIPTIQSVLESYKQAMTDRWNELGCLDLQKGFNLLKIGFNVRERLQGNTFHSLALYVLRLMR